MEEASRSILDLPPLLRWAGSKRKLIAELSKHIPEQFTRYIEPFSGSACLFFALRPQSAIISDLNEELIDAYRVLRSHPKLVYREVSAMPKDSEFYYSLRKRAVLEMSEIERAARFIYLNRNCFNGVYRTNRAGQFNVPMGKKVGELPSESHFLRCAIALRKATLMSGDFEKAIETASRGDFVYLDPPYTKRGSRFRGEYGYSSFGTTDLKRLGECLTVLNLKGATFVLSYAYCLEIRELSKIWNSKTILVRRHVAGFQKHRAVVREILISNQRLKGQTAPK